jgi:hypothetical protein
MIIRALMAVAMSFSLATGYVDSGCGQSEPAPHQEGGGHRQEPAPVPDPNTPRGSFPGNVEITLWYEQVQSQTVIVFDYGQGKLHQTGHRPGGSWGPVKVKPGQKIYVAIVPAHPGEDGIISFYVTQANNGRIVCGDSNHDTDGHGGADCGGEIII